jgi:hypothetical protein
MKRWVGVLIEKVRREELHSLLLMNNQLTKRGVAGRENLVPSSGCLFVGVEEFALMCSLWNCEI